jgi:hypothetical protein
MLHKFASKLTEEQKVYVVTRLGCYGTPSAIARDLKENFGIEVTPQSIDHYHPGRPTGAGLSQRFKDLFWEARKAWLAAAADTAMKDPLVRMRLREDMVLEARDAGDYRVANAMLDSIAKEAGGAFESPHKQRRAGLSIIQPSAIVTLTGPSEPNVAEDAEEPNAEALEGVGAAPLRRERTG